jgi:hypothetical protein
MAHDHDDDDQRWLDLLAGRESPEAGQRLRQEAAWLRAALLAYRAEAPAGPVPDPAERIQRLLQRAAEAGVLQPGEAAALAMPGAAPGRPSDGASDLAASVPGGSSVAAGAATGRASAGDAAPRRTRRDGWWPRLAASSWRWPAGAALALTDEAALRGDAALQTRAVPQPAATRDRLLAELREAGVDAMPYERLDRAGIDAELAQPVPPAVLAVLRRHGLQAPPGPNLRVEFAAAR